MTYFVAVINTVYACFGAVFCLYYAQVSGYEIKRFAPYLVLSAEGAVCLCGGMCAVLSHVFFPSFAAYIGWGCMFASGIICLMRKRKIRFRFTKRILRLCVCICATAIPLGIFAPWATAVSLPLIFVVAFSFSLPIEKAVQRHFIVKAKTKLCSHNCVKIAVTGSYGKTSVKNMLASLLSTKYKVQMTPSSFNTPMGICRFINENLSLDTEIAVFEFGARRKGDINKLCGIVNPHHAVVTAVGKAHLSTFGGLDDVIKEKTSLLELISQDGIRIIGENVPNNSSYSVISVSQNEGKNLICAKDVACNYCGSSFTVCFNGKETYCHTALLGRHNVHNILLCFAMSVLLGCDENEIAQKIARLTPSAHRQQLINKGNLLIIDDSYNANPQGVKALADTIALFDCKKAVIAQGIVECGKDAEAVNAQAGRDLASSVDYAVICGRNTDYLRKGLIEGKMSADKVFICNNLEESVKKATALLGNSGLLAFQNDIPD